MCVTRNHISEKSFPLLKSKLIYVTQNIAKGNLILSFLNNVLINMWLLHHLHATNFR